MKGRVTMYKPCAKLVIPLRDMEELEEMIAREKLLSIKELMKLEDIEDS